MANAPAAPRTPSATSEPATAIRSIGPRSASTVCLANPMDVGRSLAKPTCRPVKAQRVQRKTRASAESGRWSSFWSSVKSWASAVADGTVRLAFATSGNSQMNSAVGSPSVVESLAT